MLLHGVICAHLLCSAPSVCVCFPPCVCFLSCAVLLPLRFFLFIFRPVTVVVSLPIDRLFCPFTVPSPPLPPSFLLTILPSSSPTCLFLGVCLGDPRARASCRASTKQRAGLGQPRRSPSAAKRNPACSPRLLAGAGAGPRSCPRLDRTGACG